MRSKGFNKAGMSFWELITETLFRINNMSTLTECIPLWRVPKWLFNWNIMMKKFAS